MKMQLAAVGMALAVMGASAFGDALADDYSKDVVRPAIEFKARAFDLRDVRIGEGPFKHAQEMDGKYLLSLEPDRLLHTFRLNAGIPSKAQPLGGWEEPNGELRGHFTGHYLSACAMMYASTGDVRFKAKADAVVKGLAECQAKLGTSGYLSAFPETFFDRVEKRTPVWAPYYTLHKIYAGLIDTYTYCDNKQALEVCKKMGNWAAERNGKLSDDQMQNMLGEEHGGMNEALANLYALTADQKYLETSIRFDHQQFIGSFAKKVDDLDGFHANTQFPKFIGAARQYELTGDPAMKTAASYFWDMVVHDRSYATGGNSDGEMFTPKAKLSTGFGPSTTETCNMYNMLKLTRHLFTWEPSAEFADFYERGLFNQILGSQNPENGHMTYYYRLRSGSEKDFRGENSFECCVGTGIENHAKYGDSIYFHDGAKTLWVNQFMASELNWKDAGVKVKQETRFPDEASAKLTVTSSGAGEWTMQVRHPYWAGEGFEVRVNGQAAQAGKAVSFVAITRSWKAGDTVEVKMPFALHADAFKDNPNRMAIMNGPIVLAAEVKTANGPFPTLTGEVAQALAAMKPAVGKANTFTLSGDTLRVPGQKDVSLTFEPLYKIYNKRYMVYFDRLSAEQFAAQEAKIKATAAAEAALATRTVDSVTPGQTQLERDHDLKGEDMADGDFNDRHWRHASKWFSWDLKVEQGKPQELAVTYWGSDSGRKFDVLVDGVKVKTEELNSKHPDEFYIESYPLTAEMLKDKQKVTVKFQAADGSTAGGVFAVRVMRKQ